MVGRWGWRNTAMKSRVFPADAGDMPLLATADITSTALLFTAIIAAGVVLVALKVMTAELDFARRWHTLQQEVRVLRAKQAERLRMMQAKRR